MDLISDGDREARVIVIGSLNDPALMENLAEFTRAVAVFKDDTVRMA